MGDITEATTQEITPVQMQVVESKETQPELTPDPRSQEEILKANLEALEMEKDEKCLSEVIAVLQKYNRDLQPEAVIQRGVTTKVGVVITRK